MLLIEMATDEGGGGDSDYSHMLCWHGNGFYFGFPSSRIEIWVLKRDGF